LVPQTAIDDSEFPASAMRRRPYERGEAVTPPPLIETPLYTQSE